MIWFRSKHSSELVSTHGYSYNQVILWKYPSMQPITRLSGHQYRVLYLVCFVWKFSKKSQKFPENFKNSRKISKIPGNILTFFFQSSDPHRQNIFRQCRPMGNRSSRERVTKL